MAADLRRYPGGPRRSRPADRLCVDAGTRVEPASRPDARVAAAAPRLSPRGRTLQRAAYRALDAREDDWIVESRTLSYTQIALYLGAFLLVCGSLFYFVAARWYEHVDGVLRPFAVLGIPFIGLERRGASSLSAGSEGRRRRLLPRRGRDAAALSADPFHETGLLVVPPGTPGQLFQGGAASNHQLQVTTTVACAWCGWLALRTRTTALSACVYLINAVVDRRDRIGFRSARRRRD